MIWNRVGFEKKLSDLQVEVLLHVQWHFIHIRKQEYFGLDDIFFAKKNTVNSLIRRGLVAHDPMGYRLTDAGRRLALELRYADAEA